MKLFGISLSNPFAKSVKRSSHKHRCSSNKTQHKKKSGKHLKKHSSKKRRNKSRKYKMRGGWGGASPSLLIPNLSVMKGGWCSSSTTM